MESNKALEFINKYINEKQKINLDTELDCWYGQTVDGVKTAITETSLLEVVELVFQDLALLQKVKTEIFVIMPDGTKFGKTIRSVIENGMPELGSELLSFAKQQNIINGFADPDPETV